MTKMDVVLDVKGMSCGHCEKAVKGALDQLDGVEQVDIDLTGGKVNLTYDQAVTDLETIYNAIEDQGYDVVR